MRHFEIGDRVRIDIPNIDHMLVKIAGQRQRKVYDAVGYTIECIKAERATDAECNQGLIHERAFSSNTQTWFGEWQPYPVWSMSVKRKDRGGTCT